MRPPAVPCSTTHRTPGVPSEIFFKDSCALDGGDQSIYTLTLNAAGQNGSMPRYAENCTAVLATASSSGRYPEKYMVGTLHILLT